MEIMEYDEAKRDAGGREQKGSGEVTQRQKKKFESAAHSDEEQRISKATLCGSPSKSEKEKRRKMVNDPACSDMEFVTKDGDRVWANRAILAMASPLFSAMLTNGVTRDSTASSVPLPSITTAALLPTLEFLYTGSLRPRRFPFSLCSVSAVLHAARFLLLPSLEQSVTSFFADSMDKLLSEGSIAPLDALSYLSEALDMSLPLTHGVLSKLVSNVPDASALDPQSIAHFSADALRLYLERTRRGSLRYDGFEYPRVRCTLIWCAISMNSMELTQLLYNYLPPREESVLRLHGDRSTLQQKLKLLESDLNGEFRPWLHYLDLFRVHPDVLTEISSDETTPLLMTVVNDGHTIKYSVKGQRLSRIFSRIKLPGSDSSRLSMPLRFAIAEMPITQAMQTYEWDFVVEKESLFMSLGFCSPKALSEKDNGIWLGYQPFAWVLHSTGQLFHGSKVGKPYAKAFGQGSRIRVHVDIVNSTCRFTVDDTDYGIAWNEIPETIYPAAALTFPGMVRLESATDERRKRLSECLHASLSGEF
ncbi:hypothetical protein KP509_11G071700 [Ceratopteris richardii]|uniref:BTB domain-containing protein n=1 Tax=Ceratopteris richardii TaxID=49495 RepID=A0A8T2TWR1_CERRI|nr:hypothetical protein KP509_11G071700 [Ceratopteris richardii]